MNIKTGDIIQLGKHRLLCGNATKVPAELFDTKIRMICTDPPYGVAYVENVNFKPGNHKDEIVMNQDSIQTDEEYAQFSKDWLEQAKPHMASYNTSFIFNSDLMMCALRAGMKEAGWYYSQMIIWVKNSAFIGRKDYLTQHEIIAYGWHGRHKRERSQDRSVILYPKNRKNELHPTMKPVGLLRRLILNSTKIGETVYDPFGGSGSTLIACEHTSRKCIMIEMDPKYCETIVKRWEILTKQKAEVCIGKT